MQGLIAIMIIAVIFLITFARNQILLVLWVVLISRTRGYCWRVYGEERRRHTRGCSGVTGGCCLITRGGFCMMMRRLETWFKMCFAVYGSNGSVWKYGAVCGDTCTGPCTTGVWTG